MVVAYIALGANLGDTMATLRQAMDALAALKHSQRLACSRCYRSVAMGFVEQPDFTNAVVKLRTALSAAQLLQQLLRLEQRFGRNRSFKNAPRTLDLDILLYGKKVINTSQLTIPHPRMLERAFVLLPLAEIEPQLTFADGSDIHAHIQQLTATATLC